ncbi:hypothetical protein AHAS_Ahas15G0305200 [Arachis hypogaea]
MTFKEHEEQVTYASRLPLALEVIGSNLLGKDLEQWESVMDQYEKVSFDALEEVEQSVFLDISCYFKRHNSMKVTAVLQAHYDRGIKYHIGMLVEKSLTKIDQLRITLHDLIENMDKDICREKSSKVARKYSRLYFYKDIFKVLEDNQIKRKEVKTHRKMMIYPKYLLNSLRVLEWRRYLSRYFFSNFDPEKLSMLKLPDYLHMLPKLDSLSKILGKEGVQIIGVNERISHIQDKLSQIKYLLVLDDIDEHEQLTAIVEKPD